jgi:nitroreductase
MKTNEVLENIKARRSVRAYTTQPLSEEDLAAILEAATYAPSGMHLETWHFTAITNAGKLTKLNEEIKGAFAKSDEPRLQERGHSKTYNCYYHAPALVIVSNEPTQWWAAMDCACAIENMFLAARSLGIGSCWINQLGTTCDDPDVRAYLTSLGVPANHKVYGCVALGYADPQIPMKTKTVKEGTVTVVR